MHTGEPKTNGSAVMIDAAPDHRPKPFHSSRVKVNCPICGKEISLMPSYITKYKKKGFDPSCSRECGKEYRRRRKKGEIVKELKEWVQNGTV